MHGTPLVPLMPGMLVDDKADGREETEMTAAVSIDLSTRAGLNVKVGANAGYGIARSETRARVHQMQELGLTSNSLLPYLGHHSLHTMWARSLQISRRPLWQQQLHRTVRFSRKYNGQSQGPHTTYFQPPPPKQPSRSWRIIRTLLWSTTCFGLGAYASLWAFAFDFDDLEGQQEEIAVKEAMSAGATFHAATQVPSMAVNSASNMLDFQCSYSIHPKAVAHTGQHGSNIPCEDTWSASSFDSLKDPNKEWYEWSIFDGHAGPRTSHVLKQILPMAVGNALAQAKCMNKAYVPNDWEM